jgi:transcriptional regulator with XRE-family HTH domain
MLKLNEKIRKVRKDHGDTLEELADKINYNFSNLSKVERGVYKPTIEMIEQICDVYDVPISYFFAYENYVNDEWLLFIKEMEQKQISPDDLLNLLNIIGKFKT